MFFDENVLLTTLRGSLGRFVPNWGKIFCGYITQTEVPGFTRGQLWWEEVCVPHVYVRQQRIVQQ